jgi:hypothetical protein
MLVNSEIIHVEESGSREVMSSGGRQGKITSWGLAMMGLCWRHSLFKDLLPIFGPEKRLFSVW